MITKCIILLAIFAACVYGDRQILVSNHLDQDIIISVSAFLTDHRLKPQEEIFVDVSETFMGRVTAVLANCTDPICFDTLTVAEFSISAFEDFYEVSLVMGFNLPIKITSQSGGESFCDELNCNTRKLIDNCPPEYQVVVENQIVGCNDNITLHQICPGAFIDIQDIDYEPSQCFDGSYFNVIYEWQE